jgi:hypothetical protein
MPEADRAAPEYLWKRKIELRLSANNRETVCISFDLSPYFFVLN